MNPLFTNLTQETLAYLEDQLSNNDVAGDDELIDLFIEELSLTLEQAEAAVALRDQYLCQVFLNGQVRISEHRDRPFRLIVTGHFANA
ncbi:hypothetical protein [Pseudomonas aeruginosa]|uniref:hypothetical protein n=2 Tax=Pseudomonas aeruginosa TaxID=287 RepID=UPI001F04D084|nr:hypothetical protein [Pseudomonas aeruginosa]